MNENVSGKKNKKSSEELTEEFNATKNPLSYLVGDMLVGVTFRLAPSYYHVVYFFSFFWFYKK